jgi:hypothetical protein
MAAPSHTRRSFSAAPDMRLRLTIDRRSLRSVPPLCMARSTIRTRPGSGGGASVRYGDSADQIRRCCFVSKLAHFENSGYHPEQSTNAHAKNSIHSGAFFNRSRDARPDEAGRLPGAFNQQLRGTRPALFLATPACDPRPVPRENSSRSRMSGCGAREHRSLSRSVKL